MVMGGSSGLSVKKQISITLLFLVFFSYFFSLLVLLRCQMHAELAKCEEAEDQLEYAVTHLRKALELDDSGQYYNRLQTALTRLQLRATLYKTPERPEDLAAMIIEQVGRIAGLVDIHFYSSSK